MVGDIEHCISMALSLDKAGLPEQFAAYARRTAVPDETYFATLFMHSPFCRKIIRPSMDRGAPRVMHVEWEKVVVG